MSVSQPQASEQYERWKKYPKTYAEPTHEDWLRELSSARAEVSGLRAALECIAEGCSFPSDSVQVAVRDRARAALAATRKEEGNG